jgi:AbrB family looped-hinge helix DNA binding protein
MERITVSSKGQIVIPKKLRDALNLREGMKLTIRLRGHELILSKEAAWKKLRGMLADSTSMDDFAQFRKQEREREHSRP